MLATVPKLARSTADDTPKTTSAEDLALMRRMDELHLEYSFAGSSILRDLLRNEGHPVDRKCIRRMMRQIGIEALYCKPNSSRRHAAHPVYPYLLNRQKHRADHYPVCADQPVAGAQTLVARDGRDAPVKREIRGKPYVSMFLS